MFLNMLDNQLRAAPVAHKGALSRVVHTVGEITREEDTFPGADPLAQAEGTAEDTHVGVDTHDDNRVNASMLNQVPASLRD